MAHDHTALRLIYENDFSGPSLLRPEAYIILWLLKDIERLLAVFDAARQIPSEWDRMNYGKAEERAEKGEIGSIHGDIFESYLDTLRDALEKMDPV